MRNYEAKQDWSKINYAMVEILEFSISSSNFVQTSHFQEMSVVPKNMCPTYHSAWLRILHIIVVKCIFSNPGS